MTIAAQRRQTLGMRALQQQVAGRRIAQASADAAFTDRLVDDLTSGLVIEFSGGITATPTPGGGVNIAGAPGGGGGGSQSARTLTPIPDGVNIFFTLSAGVAPDFTLVTHNGMVLIEGVDFSRVGLNITLSYAPEAGAVLSAISFKGSTGAPPEHRALTPAPDGVVTAFTIAGAAPAFVLIMHNGQMLIEGLQFARSGNAVSMTYPPEPGATFEAIVFS